ncbi:MAG: hypothetical protein QOF58_6547 [Pseudonocardiales bacterium]|jgi:hypothetical protein|nr:hypothetical protein [Pseudonocardiales bacterium]
MSRRVWVAEGVASDGAIYGRTLQLPAPGTLRAGVASGVRRSRPAVLKSHLGDIPSCPCLAALSTPDDEPTAG